MGIFPVWGFQLIIAIALAIYFKLNKGLVILFANISLPPIIPVILFLSHAVGGYWLGENAVTLAYDREITLDFFKDSIVQYMLGAITLSVVAGMAMGLLSYMTMKIMRKTGN